MLLYCIAEVDYILRHHRDVFHANQHLSDRHQQTVMTSEPCMLLNTRHGTLGEPRVIIVTPLAPASATTHHRDAKTTISQHSGTKAHPITSVWQYTSYFPRITLVRNLNINVVLSIEPLHRDHCTICTHSCIFQRKQFRQYELMRANLPMNTANKGYFCLTRTLITRTAGT